MYALAVAPNNRQTATSERVPLVLDSGRHAGGPLWNRVLGRRQAGQAARRTVQGLDSRDLLLGGRSLARRGGHGWRGTSVVVAGVIGERRNFRSLERLRKFLGRCLSRAGRRWILDLSKAAKAAPPLLAVTVERVQDHRRR